MKSWKLILGLLFIVAGLIFSFFVPVMAVVGEVVIVELPYRNEVPGGPSIPSYQGSDELWQEFVSPGNHTVTDLYLGMVKTTNDWDGKIINVALVRSNPSLEERAIACMHIHVESIQDTATWVETMWWQIWTADYPGSPRSCWSTGGGAYIDNPEFPLVEGATYKVAAASPNGLPSVHWQLSTVNIPEWNSSEGNDFSLKLAGIKGAEPLPPPDDGNGNGNGNGNITDGNGDDIEGITENAGKVMAIFLGPLLFATGVIVILTDMEYFKNGMFAYAVLGIIWLIVFGFMFILANYYKHGGIPGLVMS